MTELERARRASSVSQALRAIRDDLESGPSTWEVGSLGKEIDFKICVAVDRFTRKRAYRLAQRVYSGCGYLAPDDNFNVSSFDADPSTLTLLAYDGNNRDAATISLVFDSAAGLPCDEIYRDELNAMRAQGRRLVEVTRLAISAEHQRSKALLIRMFNLIYIFARRVRGFDDFVIEVNPRHVDYYRNLLLFEPAGPVRPCPRVQGAPAVLLKVDLTTPDRVLRPQKAEDAARMRRTVYPSFYSWLEEGAVAEFLCRNHKPMSVEDAEYFGIAAAMREQDVARV